MFVVHNTTTTGFSPQKHLVGPTILRLPPVVTELDSMVCDFEVRAEELRCRRGAPSVCFQGKGRGNVTNSWVELTIENQLAMAGCPRVYKHMVKLILNPCETLGSYHHAPQLTSTTAHSSDIDLIVGLFLFGGSTHLSIILI